MMTRKQFLRSFAGLGVGALVIACSKSDGSPEPGVDAPVTPDAPKTPDAPNPDAPPANTCTTTNSTISANHGHTAVIPAADVTAGVMKTYDIKGASQHPHTITVTPAMFAMLKSGMMVVVTSSNDAGHTHNVTVTCA
ncbi:MAG: hypothetical protein M4D80_36820 [Myxococcota bacterium]|nr:hypothetical protein [Myxococcota bacterium]